ncbi:MAG: hypothetical protein DWQ05_09930 [Calditrichaeota bacterium]|nr:MAG: hypothetical protein DWQ05_09930 [Calditrichota bacterium]
MDFNQFKLLENKILQALERIKTLKSENSQLLERIQSLEKSVQNKENQIAELTEVRQTSESESELTEREIYISNKISEMLKKIEALEIQI